MTIRCMTKKDMPDILRIEQLSFERPWTESDFVNTCQCRNVMPRVVEHDREIVGFILYEMNSRNYRIVNLAVDPKYRREGIGESMVRWLVGKLSGKRTAVIAEPSERNLTAHLFFQSLGFRASQVIRDPWDVGEDAYRMEYRQESEVGA